MGRSLPAENRTGRSTVTTASNTINRLRKLPHSYFAETGNGKFLELRRRHKELRSGPGPWVSARRRIWWDAPLVEAHAVSNTLVSMNSLRAFAPALHLKFICCRPGGDLILGERTDEAVEFSRRRYANGSREQTHGSTKNGGLLGLVAFGKRNEDGQNRLPLQFD